MLGAVPYRSAPKFSVLLGAEATRIYNMFFTATKFSALRGAEATRI